MTVYEIVADGPCAAGIAHVAARSRDEAIQIAGTIKDDVRYVRYDRGDPSVRLLDGLRCDCSEPKVISHFEMTAAEVKDCALYSNEIPKNKREEKAP